jgi:hypothetical protein
MIKVVKKVNNDSILKRREYIQNMADRNASYRYTRLRWIGCTEPYFCAFWFLTVAEASGIWFFLYNLGSKYYL